MSFKTLGNDGKVLISDRQINRSTIDRHICGHCCQCGCCGAMLALPLVSLGKAGKRSFGALDFSSYDVNVCLNFLSHHFSLFFSKCPPISPHQK